jgi:hypothetical protein
VIYGAHASKSTKSVRSALLTLEKCAVVRLHHLVGAVECGVHPARHIREAIGHELAVVSNTPVPAAASLFLKLQSPCRGSSWTPSADHHLYTQILPSHNPLRPL